MPLARRRYGGRRAGAPLVMLHGFLCAGLFFLPNIKHLRARHHVVTVDLPGFGGSAGAAPAATIAAMARQVGQTLAAAGYRRYHLLGHSMGGMVALQLALSRPAAARSLVLYATNSSGDLPGRFETFAASKRRLRQNFAAAKRDICATWFVAGARARHFDLTERCAAAARLPAAERAIDAMRAFDVTRRLHRLKMPVLILSADLDKTYSPACQRALHKNIPQSRRHCFKNRAHCAHLEDARAFSRIVAGWLAAHSG